jgi:hypothetical protein
MLIASYGHRPDMELWCRTLRWLSRLRSTVEVDRGVTIPEFPSAPGWDTSDYALAVLAHCYAMRDWLIEGCNEYVAPAKVKALYEQSENLGICRDIVNAAKHCVLTRPASVEQRPFICLLNFDGALRLAVMLPASKTKRDLIELCESCVDEIRVFMNEQELAPLDLKQAWEVAYKAARMPPA